MRHVPLLLLGGYAAAGLYLIPYLPSNVEYLTALDSNGFQPRTVVHPLFMPVLHSLKNIFHFFGQEGSLLVPIEGFNVLVATLGLWFLYRIGERLTHSRMAAVSGALLFGMSPGVWGGCLRADPYALGMLFAVLTLYLLIHRPTRQDVLYPLLGLTSSLSFCFHAASMALLPVVFVTIFLEHKERTKSCFLYLAAFLLATTASYAVWAVTSWPAPRLFLAGSFGEILRSTESLPGTSIYTSGSVLAQLRSYGANFNYQLGELSLLLAAVTLLRITLLHEIWVKNRRSLAVLGLYFFSYSAFYLINNTQNGFVFVAGASLAAAFSLMAASFRRTHRPVPIAAAGLVLLFMGNKMFASPHRHTLSPFYQELAFLKESAGARGLILMPGCPFEDVFHFSNFYVLKTGKNPSGADCAAPSIPTGDPLAARIAWKLKRGGKVLFSEGNAETVLVDQRWGHQKSAQLFITEEETLDSRKRRIDGIRQFIAERFAWGPSLTSSGGRVIRTIVLAPGGGSRRPPLPPGEFLPVVGNVPHHHRLQERHLREVFRQNADDPYAYTDLLEFYGRLLLGAENKGDRSDWVRNIRLAEELSLRFPAASPFRIERAEYAYKLGRHADAVESLDEIRTASLPLDAEGLRRLAHLFGKLGHPDRAIAALERLTTSPEAAAADWIERAAYSLHSGRRKDAGISLEEAMQRTPNSTDLRRMAPIYAEMGQPKRALDIFEGLLVSRPADPDLWIGKAQQLRKSGESKGAHAALQQALSNSNTDGQRRAVAIVYQEWGRFNEAITILQRITGSGREAALALRDIGVCEFLRGSKSAAELSLKRAIEIEPGLLSGYLSLGTVYTSQGRNEEAGAVYRKGLLRKGVGEEEHIRPELKDAYAREMKAISSSNKP